MKQVPDIIDYNLNILFCGINPGKLSGKLKQHFAHPSNRFWKTLYESGLTSKLLRPDQSEILLSYKIGITNIVDRVSRKADDLKNEEIKQGAKNFKQKIKKYQPKKVVFLGIGIYKYTFNKNVTVGKQKVKIGNSEVWVLPNPSGLNAHYSQERLNSLFKNLA